MFSDIHHISYLVPDLDTAIESYTKMFGAVVTGRGAAANLGEVAFLQVGREEVEFISPEDTTVLAAAEGTWVVHHIAYAVENLDRVVAEYQQRGYHFLTDEPFTTFMGYRLIYLDRCKNG